jgi:hypothetical protein
MHEPQHAAQAAAAAAAEMLDPAIFAEQQTAE